MKVEYIPMAVKIIALFCSYTNISLINIKIKQAIAFAAIHPPKNCNLHL
jgi:hypothetical protein